jgi:hypothetical protein
MLSSRRNEETAMANRLRKLVWSVLCGTALGMGAAACGSDEEVMYGPPPDTSVDGDDDAADVAADEEEEEFMAEYGPAPLYGPEPSP